MKVKFLVSKGFIQKGEIMKLEQEKAERYIALGYAEKVVEVVETPKKSKKKETE